MTQPAIETSIPAAEAAFSLDRIVAIALQTATQAWTDFIARLPMLALALGIILATWLLAWTSLRVARRIAGRRARPSLLRVIERLIKLAIWATGLLLALIVVFPGVSPAKALGGLGLLSVAVGLAFRDTFENFFAGMLMLWKYPFEAGDFIECGELLGRVERVHIRMTTLREVSGELLLVPNSRLFKNPVRVLTDQPERRVSILTGVAYSVDLAAALEIVEQAVAGCEHVMRERPPQILAHGFGNSGMEIEVTWWCGSTPLAVRQSRSEVVVAVKAALDAAGMEIPFPYRTLTFAEPLTVAQDDDR